MNVIGIQRAEIFSPNSVEKDKAILEAVVSPFKGNIIPENDNNLLDSALLSMPDVVFSMARSREALDTLSKLEEKGVKVINPSEGVKSCQRSHIDRLMRKYHLPIPPSDTELHQSQHALLLGANQDAAAGYWLKRGDAAAQSHNDVVFCKDDAALNEAKKDFKRRGITDFIVQAHIKGDLVKFYGVEGTGFFRTFYPSDDGTSKFGDEKLNGKAHHYFYQKEHLQAVAEQTSRLVKTPVYGGDAIIRPDGDFVIIDFNDWPSFSRCREEAAEAIRSLALY